MVINKKRLAHYKANLFTRYSIFKQSFFILREYIQKSLSEKIGKIIISFSLK